MKVWKYFAALPFMMTGLWAASPAVDELVLPEKLYPQLDAMLKRAVQQSPRMIGRALDLEVAEGARIESRSNILPSVGGSYRFNKARDERADIDETLDVDKSYYDFSLSQPIFHWGERKNLVRMGAIQKKIADGNYREGYRLLAQEIRGQYLMLIVRKSYVEKVRISDKFNQDSLAQAEERLRQKVASDAEMFGVRINAERSTIEREKQEFEFENAKRALGRLTGGEITDQDIATEIPVIADSSGAFNNVLAGFLSQKDPVNPQAEELRDRIVMEDLSYRNQKTRLLPKFNFLIGLNQDEQSYTTNNAAKFRVNSTYAGVSVNWTIFDGFAASGGKRSALARRRSNENQYRILTEQLAADAQTQVKMLNFSARNMSIADRMLISAVGSYEARQAEFARGVISESNVTQDRLSYYDARINAINTRIDYLLKTGDFLGLVAEDPVLANAPINK
ncbi:TolC family protein [Oleiharenicola lentus]|uniref:TolC family protein n=1 Tax=Oleiharenicola lentus TaxID=2508720 RepID=UPI003F667553